MPRNVSGIRRMVFWTSRLCCVLVVATISAIPCSAQTEAEPAVSESTKAAASEKPTIDKSHPLALPLNKAYEALKPLKEIRDYEGTFSKRELIGKKLLKTTMKLKLREDPFGVYLKYVDNHPGREVLYVKGQHNNNLLVREAGFKAIIGVISLAPSGPDALAENKYPITSIGVRNMLNKVITQWEAEAKLAGTTVQQRSDAKLPLSGQLCTIYEASHAKPAKEFKYHTTRLWIEDKTGLAIGVQQLGFPAAQDKEPPLVEEYFYSDLKINPNLTDSDFDKNNKNYSFR